MGALKGLFFIVAEINNNGKMFIGFQSVIPFISI